MSAGRLYGRPDQSEAHGKMCRIFWVVRIYWKFLLLRLRLGPLPLFCKRCGVETRDFQAPDEIWNQVEPHIPHGYVLCYNCFSDLCLKLGLQPNWKLVDIDLESGPGCQG